MSVSEIHDLTGCDDMAPGDILRVEAGGRAFAVYRVQDEFYVSDDQCTHGPGFLSDGCLEGYEIECDFHQGSFDIRTGEVIEPPCSIPLRVYPVTLRDGRVTIEI